MHRADVGGFFADRRVASTPAVARFVALSERIVQEWGRALFVSRIGRAFIWTKDDVEQLVGYLAREHATARYESLDA